jgi:hypothetical protein
VFSDLLEDVMWYSPGKSKKTTKNIFHNKLTVEILVRTRCRAKRIAIVTCSVVMHILSTEFMMGVKIKYSHRCA